MSYEEEAKILDDYLTRQEEEQRKSAVEISGLLQNWDKEMEPIKRVMRKHMIQFGNPKIGAYGDVGIVVGGTSHTPLMLVRGSVFAPKEQGVDVESAVTLTEFIIRADLSVIKAGFDFVRNFSVHDNPISRRNKQLIEFLESNKNE